MGARLRVCQQRSLFGPGLHCLECFVPGAVEGPIERFFKQVEQPILRYEWREDLFYCLFSTLFRLALTIGATILGNRHESIFW